jgi:putative tryptophan/tyrosine transport system substrate-binding protein
VAPSFGLELSAVDVRDAAEIERAVTTFAHGSNGGMIVLGGASSAAARPRRRGDRMNRRRFVTLIGGAAAAWPLAARAQQPDRIRRIGVLSSLAADDQGNNVRLAAFQQRLQQLGWTDGHNVRIDYRFAAGNPENYRKYAAELVALAPDVILAPGGSLAPMLQATRTVPIVFAFAADPVGSGLVESLSRPGGNATGFLLFEYDLSAKWLELLKEIVPGVTRAAVLRDPTSITGIGQFAVIQSVARPVGVEVSPLNLRDAGETERAVTSEARSRPTCRYRRRRSTIW